MAKFIPLILSGSGNLRQMQVGKELVDYRYLDLTASAALGAYVTTLPYPFHITTASADVSNAGTTNREPAITFRLPGLTEKAYFVVRAIIASRTATAAQEPRIGLTFNTAADGITMLEHASSLTALQYRYYGLNDSPGENTSATTNPAANINYPDHVYGISQNSDATADMINTIVIVAGGGATVTLDRGTSYMMNHFIGISSSIAPKDAIQTPISITGSISGAPKIACIGSGHTIDESVLPPTASLWQSQSLATALTNTSSTVYTTIFTLTGLVDGARYLVECYIAGRSAATTTAMDFRVINADNHCGTIWTPETATTYEIRNSADGTDITSEAATTFAAANADRLLRAEYTFTKAVGSDPTIEFKSETGTTVTVQNYSVVFYRRIDEDTNQEFQTPITLVSGSLSEHTNPISGERLGIHPNSLPTFNTNRWDRLLENTIFSTTSATAQTITDLEITLSNSAKYLIVYYIGASSASSGIGVRIGVTSANLTTAYTIESPTSTTAVSIAHNATPATANSPASDLTNYYLYKIYALVTTNASGTPTFAPTLAAETNGNQVQVKDSLVYYKQI